MSRLRAKKRVEQGKEVSATYQAESQSKVLNGESTLASWEYRKEEWSKDAGGKKTLRVSQFNISRKVKWDTHTLFFYVYFTLQLKKWCETDDQ